MIFEKLFILIFASKVGNQLLISLAQNNSQDLISSISKILFADLAGLPFYSLMPDSARNKIRNAANAPWSPARRVGTKFDKVPVDPDC